MCVYSDDWIMKGGTSANRLSYARRHDYVAHIQMAPPLSDTYSVDIQHTKLLLLKRLLDTGLYDWLLWTDCDSVIMNFDKTLDSIIYTFTQTAMRGGTSTSAVKAEEAREVIVSVGGNEQSVVVDDGLSLLITEEGWGMSSGNFLVKNTLWSKEFLSSAFRLAHSEMPLFGDQDAIIYLTLQAETLSAAAARLSNPTSFAPHRGHPTQDDDEKDVIDRHAAVIPQHEINSYDQLNAEFLHCDGWKPGDLIITFPGCKDPSVCNRHHELAFRYPHAPHLFDVRLAGQVTAERGKPGSDSVMDVVTEDIAETHLQQALWIECLAVFGPKDLAVQKMKQQMTERLA
eukprot:GHVQ01007110.1.p1 GENE.GHVQ01007110.1~~GHVQ01007110.1.p1  ORF type:complete len:343 (+),score=58.00 GHVQ01007110.1:321-1349(+)